MTKSIVDPLRRLKALIKKEFFQIRRDPSTILICLVIPLILLFLYGFGVSLDFNDLRVGLVMQDTAPDAQSFAKSLTDSPYFEITIARDERELEHKLLAGKLRGIVVIPSYFSSFRNRPDCVAPIQVIADGSEPNTANFVQNYVRGAFQNWTAQETLLRETKETNLIKINPRYWFNEELESREFLIPGSMAIIMTLIGTLLTALVIAREWERGTMEALMSTEVSIYEILLSKLISYFILGMVSMGLCVFVAIVGYSIPLRGSLFLLGIVSAVFLFAALGTGLLISTLAKNQIVASQAALITGFLPAYILSGFLFEITSMPLVIQLLTYLMPSRYFVQSLQTLFLTGNVMHLIVFDLFFMLLIGLTLFLFAAQKTVKLLE